MVDGKFMAENSTTPAGQNVATELLDRCLKWSEIVLSRSTLLGERSILAGETDACPQTRKD